MKLPSGIVWAGIVAALCMSCSTPVAPSVAVQTIASPASCASDELSWRLAATPGRHIQNPVPPAVAHATRRDGTVSAGLRVPPFPLIDGVCPYRLPTEAKACSAGEIALAVTAANARKGIFMGYDVDVDCVLEADATRDDVGEYVRAVRDFAIDEHRCDAYEAYQSRLSRIEQAGRTDIVEIAFIRGYMAEICESDQAAIAYYVKSLRAGYLPAQLSLSAIFEASNRKR